MTTPTRSLTSVLSGFQLALEGARLLGRERSLWPLAAVPVLLSVLAFGGAIGFLVGYAGEAYAFSTQWLPTLEAATWYAWLWVGPGRLGLWLVGLVAFLLLAGLCLVAAYMLASLLASPFHDALALRVERIVSGAVIDETQSGLVGLVREGGRALREELRRMAFFLAVVFPLVAIGFVVPGAQLVTGPAILAFTLLFLPLDYASYTLDRRRIPFRVKRSWVLKNAPVMAGFGGAAFLICSVPLLNLAAMPLLVVGGTLLALRQPVNGALESGTVSE